MVKKIKKLSIIFLIIFLNFYSYKEIYSQDQSRANSSKEGFFNLSSFIEFEISEHSAKDSSDKILATIIQEGGTPIINGQDILFPVKHNGIIKPRIQGDFNEWAAMDGSFKEKGYMMQIGNTPWYALQIEALPEARFEYTVQIGPKIGPDSLNPRKVMTFGSMHSEVVLNGAKTLSIESPEVDKSRGKMDTLIFSSTALNNTRSLFIYLPSPQYSSDVRLPVLYILDGKSWLNAELDRILDHLITNEEITPVIAVFIPTVNRSWEYGGWKNFRKMMVAELIPKIDSIYQTLTNRANRGLLGVSRGGLAVLDLAYEESESFGFSAALAPAIQPLPFLKELEEGEMPANPPEIVVMKCLYDLKELQTQAEELASVLRRKGYPYDYLEVPIPHSYSGWRHHVDRVLQIWQKEKKRIKK